MLETHERKSYGITMGLMHTKCTFVCSALTALRFVRKQINMVKCNGKKPPPPREKNGGEEALYTFIYSF